ncbi:MAG: glycoside hydrolase, partial [Bacteroidaceae bacterium]|nr:glycoside hydrolase [Bacteroidaceae bacterium]
MKRVSLILTLTLSCLLSVHAFDNRSRWITASEGKVNEANTWIAFRRDVNLSAIPEHVRAEIAADSKYWLWVNGRLVVFEGSLKRGPNPNDSYFDVVELAPYLQKGENQIAILLWYFGKSGFSHIDSGRSGFLFSAPGIDLFSDAKWQSRVNPANGTSGAPLPN